MTWLGKSLCDRHWRRVCDLEDRGYGSEEIRKAMGRHGDRSVLTGTKL